MKICIYGAGAIGGYMGLMLHEGGADVSLIARGPHLAAIRENGLERLETKEHPRLAAQNGSMRVHESEGE